MNDRSPTARAWTDDSDFGGEWTAESVIDSVAHDPELERIATARDAVPMARKLGEATRKTRTPAG